LYKQLLLAILLTAPFLGCTSAHNDRNRAEEFPTFEEYPAWFLYPPLHDEEFHAVGICQPCLDNDSSISLAATDAHWKIVNMQGLRIKSKAGISGPTPRIAHMGQNIIFETDTSKFETITTRYTVMEKYFTNNMLVVLVGPKGDSNRTIGYSHRDYGEWWLDVPHDDDFLYAVGSTPNYYYESSSWNIAMNNALIEMTRQISLTVKSLLKYDGETVDKTFIEEGDVLLNNWRVVARHYSANNKTFHILIRMPR